MTTHIIVGIIAFVCGVLCAISGTLLVFEMVDSVNDKLPEEQQFSPLWWYPSKYGRLFTEYKRLYPDGRLAKRFRLWSAALRLLICGCLGTGILLAMSK